MFRHRYEIVSLDDYGRLHCKYWVDLEIDGSVSYVRGLESMCHHRMVIIRWNSYNCYKLWIQK